MSELHQVYLSIGSNIKPEYHLKRAIDLLGAHGYIEAISTVWESHAIGSEGPNFLNACALLLSPLSPVKLKAGVVYPIEAALGRTRSEDKNAPRTIDLDIVMIDKKPVNLERWSFVFVVVPMAELLPDLRYPLTGENLSRAAERMRAETWIVKHPEMLKSG